MKRDEQLRNLARNLQSICRTFSSVADACRVLGVNRQQFNKYLAGKHVPAPKVLASVARHFSIVDEDLFASEAQFEMILKGPHSELARDLQLSPEFQRFAPFIGASKNLLKSYAGVYFRYHNSSIYKGQILRSVLWMYEHNTTMQYVCIERFPRREGNGKGKIEYLFRYHGFALMIGDRIFLIDSEGLQRNEMTFSILLPRHRNVLRFLYGIVSGVASTALREPFSTRLVLDYQGPQRLAKVLLGRATALLPSDKTIPLEARTYLTGKNATIIWGGGP